jgi:hypothetical protein
MKKIWIVTALILNASLPSWAGDPKLGLLPEGIQIDAGKAGTFVLGYPVLNISDESQKPVMDISTKNKAVAKYESGARMEIEVSGNQVTCRFAEVPEFGRSWQCYMPIPGGFINGGKYALAGKEPVEFPKEKGKDQHLEKGESGGKLALFPPGGGGFTLETVTNWYGMQDNRVNGWGNNFVYSFLYDIKAHPGVREFKITFESAKP